MKKTMALLSFLVIWGVSTPNSFSSAEVEERLSTSQPAAFKDTEQGQRLHQYLRHMNEFLASHPDSLPQTAKCYGFLTHLLESPWALPIFLNNLNPEAPCHIPEDFSVMITQDDAQDEDNFTVGRNNWRDNKHAIIEIQAWHLLPCNALSYDMAQLCQQLKTNEANSPITRFFALCIDAIQETNEFAMATIGNPIRLDVDPTWTELLKEDHDLSQILTLFNPTRQTTPEVISRFSLLLEPLKAFSQPDLVKETHTFLVNFLEYLQEGKTFDAPPRSPEDDGIEYLMVVQKTLDSTMKSILINQRAIRKIAPSLQEAHYQSLYRETIMYNICWYALEAAGQTCFSTPEIDVPFMQRFYSLAMKSLEEWSTLSLSEAFDLTQIDPTRFVNEQLCELCSPKMFFDMYKPQQADEAPQE